MLASMGLRARAQSLLMAQSGSQTSYMQETTGMPPDMRASEFRHVYWVGGGSGAGKSTVATRLGSQYGMRVYRTDDVMGDHWNRCDPQECPCLAEFVGMTMDERWVNRSPEVMLETFHWFRGEGFNLIIEDLLELPADRPVVVEGFRLLPALVEPLLLDRRQAVWLLPSPDFRLSAFESRGSLMDIADKTSDPPRALNNLLRRDGLFTDRLRAETQSRELTVITVTEGVTVEESTRQVALQFGLEA